MYALTDRYAQKCGCARDVSSQPFFEFESTADFHGIHVQIHPAALEKRHHFCVGP